MGGRQRGSVGIDFLCTVIEFLSTAVDFLQVAKDLFIGSSRPLNSTYLYHGLGSATEISLNQAKPKLANDRLEYDSRLKMQVSMILDDKKCT